MTTIALITGASKGIGFAASGHRSGRPTAAVPYPSSKAALNMVTAMYAKELRNSRMKVNAANPGYCATDLNGRSGFRSPEQGAEVSVHLATLPQDGLSGSLWDTSGALTARNPTANCPGDGGRERTASATALVTVAERAV